MAKMKTHTQIQIQQTHRPRRIQHSLSSSEIESESEREKDNEDGEWKNGTRIREMLKRHIYFKWKKFAIPFIGSMVLFHLLVGKTHAFRFIFVFIFTMHPPRISMYNIAHSIQEQFLLQLFRNWLRVIVVLKTKQYCSIVVPGNCGNSQPKRQTGKSMKQE